MPYNEENVNRKLQDNLHYYLENRGKTDPKTGKTINLNDLIYQRPDLREAYSKKDNTMSPEYLNSMRDDKYQQEMHGQEALARGLDPSLLDRPEDILDEHELDILKTKAR